MKKIYNTGNMIIKSEGLVTPAYIIDERRLEENGMLLKKISEDTGCRFLLAQKAFSNFQMYPLLSEYLSGTEASGLYEARLGYEEMPGKEVHIFSTAYKESEFDEIMRYADHIIFNSVHQLRKYGEKAKKAGKSIGLRINPEISTQKTNPLYNPCSKESRLGVTKDRWDNEMTDSLYSLIDGIHFHTLCEQNSDALKVTLSEIEKNFGDIIRDMKWINMGGGQLITKKGYDIDTLDECISRAVKEWNTEVYLEPGEAVALNAGYMISQVLDIVKKDNLSIAIMDASPACHMPDVLEMPYRPEIIGASGRRTSENTFEYQVAGNTCLAGDIAGKYYFRKKLKEGDILIFKDMAIYTMCKNNTFNGIKLPGIYLLKKDGTIRLLKNFGYDDFRNRLGQ